MAWIALGLLALNVGAFGWAIARFFARTTRMPWRIRGLSAAGTLTP